MLLQFPTQGMRKRANLPVCLEAVCCRPAVGAIGRPQVGAQLLQQSSGAETTIFLQDQTCGHGEVENRNTVLLKAKDNHTVATVGITF